MRLLRLLILGVVVIFSHTAAGGGVGESGTFNEEESRLCAELTITSRAWARVRWEVSLTEARLRAERERKPIFLVVNTGNVLGFV